MTEYSKNSLNTETINEENVEASRSNRIWLFLTFAVVILAIGAGLLAMDVFGKDEKISIEAYRFVNNNSAVCTRNQEQIDCVNVETNQKQTITIPVEYKELTVIEPSHDGTKLLLSLNYYPDNSKYVVTNTDFTNPQEVVIPYNEQTDPNIVPEVIWGSNSNKLLISKQVREENDADFLPGPLVVWEYVISTKETKRIFKNGSYEETPIKVIGASDEYLFITQPIFKNWVAKDTDPPADTLLAVRLDDGFVRVVTIESIVKLLDRNKYAAGISITYDPTVSTFYIGGQNQASGTDLQNFYAAAKLDDSNGLVINEISRLTSQAQYYGITTSKGTLVIDWLNELEGFKNSFVASSEETHEIENISSDKDDSKFVIASLPNAE